MRQAAANGYRGIEPLPVRDGNARSRCRDRVVERDEAAIDKPHDGGAQYGFRHGCDPEHRRRRIHGDAILQILVAVPLPEDHGAITDREENGAGNVRFRHSVLDMFRHELLEQYRVFEQRGTPFVLGSRQPVGVEFPGAHLSERNPRQQQGGKRTHQAGHWNPQCLRLRQ